MQGMTVKERKSASRSMRLQKERTQREKNVRMDKLLNTPLFVVGTGPIERGASWRR